VPHWFRSPRKAGPAARSDFGEFIAGGGDVTLAASAEFVNSEAALPAFQDAYASELAPDQLVILSGDDTAATIAAAAQGTDGANAAMVYGTDGAIQEVGLMVLEDDKSVQPVYAPTPIVRREALEANPQIGDGLDLETLQRLNARIQLGGESAQAVAQDYLQTQGFID
jgi:osmoprotectant transport system substrate-binding protein